MIESLLAQSQTSPGRQLFLGLILPFAIMFFILYVLMIRPQQKKEQQRRKMLESLKKNDRVVTAGGIHGVIQAIKGDEVFLRVADNVVLKLSRSAISRVVGSGKNE